MNICKDNHRYLKNNLGTPLVRKQTASQFRIKASTIKPSIGKISGKAKEVLQLVG
jgi:hypothetical protein